MASKPTDHTRWLALVSRDRSAAKDTFVYAVRTTKIYCRPSCPSRLARRANVEFYDVPAQAEKAGYRACKRCKPNLKMCSPSAGRSETEGAVAVRDPVAGETQLDYAQHERMIATACRSIREKGGVKRLKELSGEAGLTPSHFHRVFKKVMGVTPGEYGKRVREQIGGEVSREDIGEEELGGKEYERMIEDGLVWAEASAENWEAINDLSAVIERREDEGEIRETSLGLGHSRGGLGVPASFHADIGTQWNDSAVDYVSNPYEYGSFDDRSEIPGLGFDDTLPTTPDISLTVSDMDINMWSTPPDISSCSPEGLQKDVFDLLCPRMFITSTDVDLTIYHPPQAFREGTTSKQDELAMMGMQEPANVFSNSFNDFLTWT